jgi:biotin transport system ATP-binding protein
MIELRDLVYRYGTGDERDSDAGAILNGISLDIDSESFVLLVGPNGSGKSTLVRHLNGLLAPDRGVVRVNRVDVQADPVTARRTVAMTFQNPRDAFVASTVGADVAFGPENLGLARTEIDRRVEAALDAVGMDGRADDRLTDLSGGEQTRVGVAGALAMDPEYLVLDEPFAGLDWPARRGLLDRLRTLHRAGTGVICVSHDLAGLVEIADRVIALVDGEVAADGPPAALTDRLAELGVRVPERIDEPKR